VKEDNMFRILVPVNGSPDSTKAVERAIRLCALRSDAQLHLVNVQPLFSRHIARFLARATLEEERRRRAAKALAAARSLAEQAGVAFACRMVAGPAAGALAAYVRDFGIDQIVIGTARKPPLLRLLTGSLTTRLIELAPVPVEVIAGSRPGTLARWGLPAGIGLGVAIALLAAE
jgi:nucleotide-binding universal stress UspA family protein